MPIAPELGQRIAELINQRDCADIMVEAAIKEQPFDIDKARRWRAEGEQASQALRELGIPVVN